MLWVIIALALVQAPAFAQSHSRPANAADFSGIFALIDYPEQRQPTVLKGNPWPAACQFFGHYPDGYWLHQETSMGACRNSIPSRKPALPQTVQWRLLQDGFVVLDRKDAKVQELWKVDRVTGPANVDRINLNDGDLIMQLLDVRNKQVIWIRLLRRAGNAGG